MELLNLMVRFGTVDTKTGKLNGFETIEVYRTFLRDHDYTWISFTLSSGLAEAKIKHVRNEIEDSLEPKVYVVISQNGGGDNEIEFEADVLDIISSTERTQAPDDNFPEPFYQNSNVWIKVSEIRRATKKVGDFVLFDQETPLAASLNGQCYFAYIKSKQEDSPVNDKRKSIWPLPGGNTNYVQALKTMLFYISKNKPSRNAFGDFVKSAFSQVKSDQVITSYLNVLTGIGLVERQGNFLLLTDDGEDWLNDGSDAQLFTIIDKRVILFGDLLPYLQNPITGADLLVRVKQDYDFINWDSPTQIYFRLFWFQSMGIVDSLNDGYVLTQLGKKLSRNSLPLPSVTQRIIQEKAEIFTAELDMALHEKRVQQVTEFQQRFPKDRLTSLTPQELWKKGNPNTFFNWVENKTPGSLNVYSTFYQGFLDNLDILRQAFTVLTDDDLSLADKFNQVWEINIPNFKDQLISKILALYYPEQVVFAFQPFDKKMFLAALTGQFVVEGDRGREFEIVNREFIDCKNTNPAFRSWDLIKFIDFCYRGLGRFNLFAYSSEELNEYIPQLNEEKLIALGWNNVGDLSQYSKKEYLHEEVQKHSSNPQVTQALWAFKSEAKEGDLVAVANGQYILALGRISGAYEYVKDEAIPYSHRRKIEWLFTYKDPIMLGPKKGYKNSQFKQLDNFEEIKRIVEATGRSLIELRFAKPRTVQNPPKPEIPQPVKEYSFADFQRDTYFNAEFLEDLETLVEDKKQLVLFGPPGTGKTFVAERLALRISQSNERIKLIQFHPSYCYEEFIEGLRPVTVSNGEKTELHYKVIKGIFRELSDQARGQKDTKYVMIIDEINRGNLPKIFGELLYLLEYRGKSVQLPYSQDNFNIPDNVYLIGTMNTSDRSIAALDFALRRRFSFVPLFPADHSEVLPNWLRRNYPEFNWVAGKYEKLNQLIEDDHIKIGYSYFMCKDLSQKKLDLVWRYNLIPLLKEYFFNDLAKISEFEKVWTGKESNIQEVAATSEELEEDASDE